MARILIVDDSTVQRTILKKYLERDGHATYEAKDGQAALILYHELKPDIVLLDIVMPDSNGITILDTIMTYDKNANIIMCTSTALKNVIIESIQIGAKGFLVKPITADALLKTVNNVLQMTQNVENHIRRNY